MGKALKTVGMIVGAAALAATGAGMLLMPGLAGATTLFGVSLGTLNTVSAGLAAVGAMLDQPKSSGSGSPTDWTSNPDQPTPFAFGRVGVAGKIIHRDEYGKDNKLQGIVSVYSGAGPIRGFVSYKADDLPVSFVSNGGTAIGKYNRQMWRSWRLGNQPDTALSLPTGLDEGAVMPQWDARYRLSGKACDLWTLQQDSKLSVYPGNAEPKPTVELDGIFGYDPRFDDNYPGGAGDCRLNVRSTYRWIDNGAIAGLNWSLGMIENGKVVGGIGASLAGIDVPAFVEAANIADANDWKLTAWPDTSEDVFQVLKQMLQAAGAVYARHAGKISCVSRGAARPSIVTITGRDTAGPLELDTGSSAFNRRNTITPSFMSAAHGWKIVPADPVTFQGLRDEDGRQKGDATTYRFACTAKQAGQLAAYDILDSREPFSGTIPLKPHLRRLKRGDCFDISEPGFLLDGVKCIVLTRTYDAKNGEVRIAFRSETDGKHDLALGKTATLPAYPVLTPADPNFVSPPNPEDWVIEVRPPSTGGVQVPGFDLSGAVGNATATAVQVEWWMVPQGADPNTPPGSDQEDEWVQAGIWPPTTKAIPIDVPPGRSFWIGLSYIRGQNTSVRTLDGPRLSPGLIAGDVVPTAPALRPLLDGLGRVPGLLEEQRKNAINILEEVISRREIDRTDREAAIKRDDAIGNDLVRTKETLEVAVNGAVALIDSERSARITADSAEATTRNNQVVALGQSIAGVESSVSTVATNLSAETNLRTLQYSQTSGSLAIIDTRSQTTATNLSAETSTRQTQISSLNGNLSVVDARSQTNVTNLQALSSTTNTLSTDFQGFKALATNDIQLLSTASSAQGSQLNLLAVTVGQNGAAITSLNTALVTESQSRATGDSSLQALYNGVSSTVSIQQTAIAGLEAQNNLARLDLIVAAGGGRPAQFGMKSTVAGSSIALKADQLWFGDYTYFDDVPAVFRTLTGGGRQRLWGGLFGAGGEMLDWLGPVTVPIGQMSRANADFFLAASEPRIGGNSFPGGGGSSGGFKAFGGGLGALTGAYSIVGTADVASIANGSRLSMEVSGRGGAFGSPSASCVVTFKVTAQAVSGGAEYSVGEYSVTAQSSGLALPGGAFSAEWEGVAFGSAIVPVGGSVRLRLYAQLYTGVTPSGASADAIVTITQPAS